MNGPVTHEGGVDPVRFGQYTVIRKIATGGMAEVFLCRLDSEDGFTKKLAVKAINRELSRDGAFRELFAREARLASSLSHPNVVSVFDFGHEGNRCYLVMEFIDGCSLSELFPRMRAGGIRIPLSVWRFWMESVFSGLGYLHARGIIHRDISPGNILVTRSGAVKISDFGISRTPFTEPARNSSVDGKIGYMSPEALDGSCADPRSDLFSAALIGTELLLGRPLFRPETLLDARRIQKEFDPAGMSFPTQDVNPEVAGILRKALAFQPENRFQDSDAICMAIEAAIPFRATRTEGEAFWDSLFPDRSDNVTEVDIEPDRLVRKSGGAPAIVRESRSPYGSRARGVAMGLAAILSIAAGGSLIQGQIRKSSPGDDSMTDRSGSGKAGDATFAATDRRALPPPAVVHRIPDHPTSVVNVPARPGSRNIPQGPAENYAPVSRSPVPATGLIPVIQAIPWAKVYDGDRYLGDTPLRDVELAVGDHRLRFVNEPLGAERVLPLKVEESGNQKVIVTLVGSRAMD